MKTVKVQLPDGTAARLEAAAVAADVPTAGYAAALIGEALEVGLLAAVTPPQAVARTPQAVEAAEEPTEATAVSLALCFLRDDREGARVILNNTSLPLLIASTMAWFNGEGIREYGQAEWDARLVAFLAEAARLRSASPGDDHSA